MESEELAVLAVVVPVPVDRLDLRVPRNGAITRHIAEARPTEIARLQISLAGTLAVTRFPVDSETLRDRWASAAAAA